MTESLPVWFAAPAIIGLGLLALYVCLVRPGYDADKEEMDDDTLR
jgi:hypothetical protein